MKHLFILSNKTAFSLIELSIVIVIMSIMTAGGLTIGQAYITRTEYQATDDRLDELVQALKAFHHIHGRLPCPASRTAVPGDAEFGREMLAGACATDNTVPGGTVRVETSPGSGVWVRIGGVPAREMQLADPMMQDAFQRRFTYAVMEGMTDASTFDGTDGALVVNDGTGTDTAADVSFAVLSHGEDGRGAYGSTSGALVAACGSSAKRDGENCDADTVFTDSVYNDGVVEAKFFDDRIRWASQLVTPLVATCPEEEGSGGGGGGSGTDPCAASPAIGTLCADGTIYAGNSPDGNMPMYTTAIDSQGYWGTYGFVTGSTSRVTGEANTADVVAHVLAGDGFANPDDGDDDNIFLWCTELSAHGHDDWYVPAMDELEVLLNNYNEGELAGTFGEYQFSSTEIDANKGGMWRLRSTGSLEEYVGSWGFALNEKHRDDRVRCVRKD